MKLTKRVELEREKERFDAEGLARSRGYAFIDFVKHEDALFFVEYLIKNYQLVSRTRVPIIEFAIDDVRLSRKKEKIVENIKKKQEKVKKEKKYTDPKEDDAKKLESRNREKVAKLAISQILEENDITKIKEAKENLSNIISRGLKQRLKKKIDAQFHIQDTSEKPKNKKNKGEDPALISLLQKKVQAAWSTLKKKNKFKDETDEVSEEVKKLHRKLKNKRKEKRKHEEHDAFDNMADQYLKKIHKK